MGNVKKELTERRHKNGGQSVVDENCGIIAVVMSNDVVISSAPANAPKNAPTSTAACRAYCDPSYKR